jgi:hypothetical protein
VRVAGSPERDTPSSNEGYVSVSVAVPIGVLLAALSQMLVVSWVGKEQPELIAQASV